MGTALNERRQEHRYEGVFAEYALIQSVNDATPAVFKGSFLRNFSENGASLFIHEKPPPGVLVRLRLYEPHSTNPLELTAGVVWVERSAESPTSRDRFNVGMKFLNISTAVERRLVLLTHYFEAEKNRPYTISSLIP
jgi:hypothetical protein